LLEAVIDFKLEWALVSVLAYVQTRTEQSLSYKNSKKF